MSVEQTARRINDWAAAIANRQANRYFASLPEDDPRSLNRDIFAPKDWNQHGPFGLVMVETGGLTEDDKIELRNIAKYSVRQALAEQPELLAELITSYTAQGKNFYEVFRR